MKTTHERKEHFIQRATVMHKNKYDYSLVEYITAKVKVKIICPIHGVFEQTPDSHLGSRNSTGCPECANKSRRERIKTWPKYINPGVNKQEFLKRCEEKYGNKFIYNTNNYQGMTKCKISITCSIHGEFFILPYMHLFKQVKHGCPKCANEITGQKLSTKYIDLIHKCNNLYNFKYEYPDYNKKTYRNSTSKIDVVCPEHGKFTLKGRAHAEGQECHPCLIRTLTENGILAGGYSEELFFERPDLAKEMGYLYYLSINDGEYYKIGITKTSVKDRIKGSKCVAKSLNDIITLKEIASTSKTLIECFRAEQQILRDFKHLRRRKSWSTEIFKSDIYPLIQHYFVPDNLTPSYQTHH